jgi:hypothetical protein
MRRFPALVLLSMLVLSACRPASGPRPVASGTPSPSSAFASASHVETTYIQSGTIGRIVVRVASPRAGRYPDGAGIVVIVSPIFGDINGFVTQPDVPSLGLIQVSYLWPGGKDSLTRTQSEGSFDYGGEQSAQVLTDVIRFAAGHTTDVNGHRIYALTGVTPLTDQVGVYAFSEAGLVAVNAFSIHGDLLQQDVNYYIGRENPTLDTLASLETGYFSDSGQPVINPLYTYPGSYSPDAVTINYANLRWDPYYVDSHTKSKGRPYLDLDGNGIFSEGDFPISGQVPVMFGKRYYSAGLTQALADNGSLNPAEWPKDVATPSEAAQAWQVRQSTGRYKNLMFQDPNWQLRVMLVFAAKDHLQEAVDKPHIHQAFQGFRFQANLWVRLNPDRVYVQDMLQKAAYLGLPGTPVATATQEPALEFPDNPANTQPDDWMNIRTYAYPDQGLPENLVPLAAMEEMADRSYDGRWDENFGQVLYSYSAPAYLP